MNITKAEKGKIENWIRERTPQPPRFIEELFKALEKRENPLRANEVTFSFVTGYIPPEDDMLQDPMFVLMRLLRKGDSWYLNN